MRYIAGFELRVSAPFVRFCNDLHPLHVLKPCKNRAETVHLLPDKLKTTSSDNDLTALVRVTAHHKSSLGGYDYDEIAFLPLQHGYQPGGSQVRRWLCCCHRLHRRGGRVRQHPGTAGRAGLAAVQ